jgi:SAM-dependent methyltransferase
LNCRHCATPLNHTFIDLGFAPPSNAYLTAAELDKPEKYFPLRVKVCDQCWLVQTEDHTQANELFSADYAYFSSTSSGWLAHAEHYVKRISSELNLNSESLVIEVASNDGYLLKNFVAMGVPCLGIEPTDSTAIAAEAKGIPILREFFGEALGKQLAREDRQADLIVGNNVYAHVPNINDFTRGLKAVLKPDGTITLEFPHLMRLLEHCQFDTIYHEHYSYLSLSAVSCILQSAGLRVWQVEELNTHGGSLRIFGCHDEDDRENHESVAAMLQLELNRGLQQLETYLDFQTRANKIKNDLLHFLIKQKRAGKKVAAYGAAAKGNTLLNYAGVKPDLLPFVCDAAPAKQGKFMPGSHIPIFSPDQLLIEKPGYVLILPWNICDEIRRQNAALEKAGVRFITVVPELKVL